MVGAATAVAAFMAVVAAVSAAAGAAVSAAAEVSVAVVLDSAALPWVDIAVVSAACLEDMAEGLPSARPRWVRVVRLRRPWRRAALVQIKGCGPAASRRTAAPQWHATASAVAAARR